MNYPATSFSARTPMAPARHRSGDHVCILMGVLNGARHLGDQLDSLTAQTHADWSLVAGDDGSTDGSQALLAAFRDRLPAGQVRIVPGPRRGFQANYLALLGEVPDHAGYIAFADQDDVWLPGKLARAVAWLAAEGERPALYAGRTLVCDAALRPLGPSRLFRRPPGFRHALTECIGGGNTMVLNRAAIRLVRDAAAEAGRVASHDWWAYQIVTGAGGVAHYDPEPAVLYRQHGGNLVGAKKSIAARWRRLIRLVGGDFGSLCGVHLAALDGSSHRLLPENRALLRDFARIGVAGPARRLGALCRLRPYRQGAVETAALWAAALAGRLRFATRPAEAASRCRADRTDRSPAPAPGSRGHSG